MANAPVGDIEALARQAELAAAERVESGKRKFVPSSSNSGDIDSQASKIRAAESMLKSSANPDEIDIDMDDADEVPSAISEKPVPSAVFGSVGKLV